MQTIAVIFGGRSAEHDVSVVTAIASIIRPLELTRQYRVEAVYIDKTGKWFWDDRLKDIKLFSSGEIAQWTKRARPASIQFDGGMTLVKPGVAGRQKQQRIDLVFPAMHGTYGEDGSLMGFLEMAGVPYVGCGVEASAIAMNKVLTKLIVEAHHIPTPKFQYFTRATLEHDTGLSKSVKETLVTLQFPLFVKPAHGGSSIGITKAQNETELRNGLEVAVRFDELVLVEEGVSNLIEVTLPIIGNDDLTPAYLEQPLTTSEDFFDFDTKYIREGGGKKMAGVGGAKQGAQGYSTIPADLPKKLYDEAEKTGLAVYRALGCSGLARVDMLIDSKAGTVYCNEVNPLPGSLYAHNWQRRGISNVELVTRLIELAEARFAARQTLTTTFSTNFLKQF